MGIRVVVYARDAVKGARCRSKLAIDGGFESVVEVSTFVSFSSKG